MLLLTEMKIVRMIILSGMVVFAQKPPPPLELKEDPPKDFSTEVLIGCIICGVLTISGVILLNVCCGGSISSIACLRKRAEPLTDEEM